MHSSRLAVALAVSMPACAAFAAGHAAAMGFQDGLTAVVCSADVPLDVTTHPPVPRAQGTSAGIAPTLPAQLDTTIPGTQIPFYLINVGLLDQQHSPDTGCVSVDDPNCDAPR